MTRILIFASPAWLSFALLGLVRALWFAAGAEWNQPEKAAITCLIFGVTLGIVVIVAHVTGDLK